MKKIATLVLLVFFATSCKEVNKDSKVKNESTDVVKKETITNTSPKKNTTYLCKINGKGWSYTKASGIVSRHKKTKKRTAIITFTKQLEKGKESVQFFYDGDSNQLEQVSILLKVPKKGGGKMTAMYLFHPNTMKFHPDAKISGIIDLSNPTSASGIAIATKLNIRYEEDALDNMNDAMITTTDMEYKGIGYSDSERLFGSQGGQNN